PKNGHAVHPVQGMGRQASLLASFTGFVAMLSARRLFGAVCCAVLPITAAAAQGWIEPIRPVLTPTAPRSGIEKVRSAVQVAVVGRVARVTVEEWFRNAGALLDEGNRSEEHTSELQS